jgi:uncharacterized membrane protein
MNDQRGAEEGAAPDPGATGSEPPEESGTGAEDVGEPSDRRRPSELQPHVAAMICYSLSFATGVVFLLLETEHRTVRFHAFQSVLLGVVFLILEVGIWILGLIPPLGWLLAGVLHWVVFLALVGLTIFLMAKAYGGEEYQLPYVGPRAFRLAYPDL